MARRPARQPAPEPAGDDDPVPADGPADGPAGSLREAGRRARRDTVLAAARGLLEAEGAGALTVRRVAETVGASTMVLYTLFEGKDGLLAGLHAAGFAGLSAALAGAPGERRGPPLRHLLRIADAYREWARANPSLYALMYAPPTPGFEPPDASQIRQQPGWAVLTDAVAACAEAGLLSRAQVPAVADVLWGTLHGIVSLELAGYFPDADTAAKRTTLAVKAALAGMAR